MADNNSTDIDSVKRRIEKLLAMANDGRGNENEADSAMRMAEKLIRKHNIDVAELASKGTAPKYTWTSTTVSAGENDKKASWRPMWVGLMAMGVANFCDVKAGWTQTAYTGHGIVFTGDTVDMEYALWLFRKLRDFGYSEGMTVPGNIRENFKKAYALRVQARLVALRKERDQAMREAVTATGNALMVLTDKLALRDKEFGKQKVSHRNTRVHDKGFAQGQAAGDRVNFNRPVGGSVGQQRISA